MPPQEMAIRKTGKPGAVLSATYMGEGLKMRRVQAAVEVRPKQYITVVYHGPDDVRGRATPIFDGVVDSLLLLPDAYDAEQLRKAGEEGFIWLKSVGGISLKKAIRPETKMVAWPRAMRRSMRLLASRQRRCRRVRRCPHHRRRLRPSRSGLSTVATRNPITGR